MGTETQASRITYSYPGDGQTTLFPVRWPFLDRRYVLVTLKGENSDSPPEDITHRCQWISDSQIRISPAPESGSLVTITRKTPKDHLLVTFQDGSIQRAEDHNTANTQLLHALEENQDFSERVREYAELGERSLEQLLGLAIAVEGAPAGHAASGSYNRATGVLTLRIPEGAKGEQGGIGDRGERGAPGPNGKDGPMGPPGTAPRIDTIDCGHAPHTQITIIDAGTAASFKEG